MKRLAIITAAIIVLSTIGIASPAFGGGDSPSVKHSLVTPNSVWTFYDLSQWPSTVQCEVVMVLRHGQFSGAFGDSGFWSATKTTVTLTGTYGTGILSGGKFKGTLASASTVTFVGLQYFKKFAPAGPDEFVYGSDPYNLGTCSPEE
jgi:hypothetical protein